MAHLLHSMERPSPFVATRSYTGRRRVTMLASRARAASVDVLTPPAIVGVLSAGYEPRWHPSATD